MPDPDNSTGPGEQILIIHFAERLTPDDAEIMCPGCNRTFYTNPETLALAHAEKMIVICKDCFPGFINANPEDDYRFKGRVCAGKKIFDSE